MKALSAALESGISIPDPLDRAFKVVVDESGENTVPSRPFEYDCVVKFGGDD